MKSSVWLTQAGNAVLPCYSHQPLRPETPRGTGRAEPGQAVGGPDRYDFKEKSAQILG